jgi:hypothetical protein
VPTLIPGSVRRAWTSTSIRRRCYFQTAERHLMTSLDGRVVNYRADTGEGLGVVSSSHYKLVQPGEIIDFYREFTATGGLKLNTAGALRGGRRIWALAELDSPIRVGDDVTKPYFLLTTELRRRDGDRRRVHHDSRGLHEHDADCHAPGRRRDGQAGPADLGLLDRPSQQVQSQGCSEARGEPDLGGSPIRSAGESDGPVRYQ